MSRARAKPIPSRRTDVLVNIGTEIAVSMLHGCGVLGSSAGTIVARFAISVADELLNEAALIEARRVKAATKTATTATLATGSERKDN